MDSAEETLSLRRYGASPGSHSHRHFQVLIGLSGALELEVDGRGLRLATGEGYVIAPHARHDFESLRGSLCLVLDSGDPGWERCLAPLQPLRSPAAAHSPHHLARYLAQALSADSPLARLHGPGLLREAWLNARASAGPLAVHAHTASGFPLSRDIAATPSSMRSIPWPALERWAQEHWHATLTVADLAAQVHLSASQFSARCRAEQGQSAMAWLRALRLEQARWLKRQGASVAEAARRTGYRSPSALTAALRRNAL